MTLKCLRYSNTNAITRLILGHYIKKICATWNQQTDPIERIYRCFIIVRMSFNGSFGKGGASFDIKRSRVGVLKHQVDNLDRIVDRLRTVQIAHDTWEVILDRYDEPGAFFYLDLPYVLSVRNGARGNAGHVAM